MSGFNEDAEAIRGAIRRGNIAAAYLLALRVSIWEQMDGLLWLLIFQDALEPAEGLGL